MNDYDSFHKKDADVFMDALMQNLLHMHVVGEFSPTGGSYFTTYILFMKPKQVVL